MFKTLTENPIPTAMVGLGMIWLLTKPEESSGERQRDGTSRYLLSDNPEGSLSRSVMHQDGQTVNSEVDARISEWSDQAGAQAVEWKDRAQHQAQEWKEETRQQLQQWKQQGHRKIQTLKHEADQKLEDVKDYLHHQGTLARGEFNHLMERNPWAVGAAMVAVGAAVAAVLPGSRTEHQLMSESRDQIVNTMKIKVQSAVDNVTDVVEKEASKS